MKVHRLRPAGSQLPCADYRAGRASATVCRSRDAFGDPVFAARHDRTRHDRRRAGRVRPRRPRARGGVVRVAGPPPRPRSGVSARGRAGRPAVGARRPEPRRVVGRARRRGGRGARRGRGAVGDAVGGGRDARQHLLRRRRPLDPRRPRLGGAEHRRRLRAQDELARRLPRPARGGVALRPRPARRGPLLGGRALRDQRRARRPDRPPRRAWLCRRPRRGGGGIRGFARPVRRPRDGVERAAVRPAGAARPVGRRRGRPPPALAVARARRAGGRGDVLHPLRRPRGDRLGRAGAAAVHDRRDRAAPAAVARVRPDRRLDRARRLRPQQGGADDARRRRRRGRVEQRRRDRPVDRPAPVARRRVVGALEGAATGTRRHGVGLVRARPAAGGPRVGPRRVGTGLGAARRGRRRGRSRGRSTAPASPPSRRGRSPTTGDAAPPSGRRSACSPRATSA